MDSHKVAFVLEHFNRHKVSLSVSAEAGLFTEAIFLLL